MSDVSFAQRRSRFGEKLVAGGVAIVTAAHEVVRSNDTEYPFRQDSDFHYLTGFPEPDAVAVIRPGHAKPYILFVRPKDREREIWTGVRAGPHGAMERYGADESFPLTELPAKLAELIAGAPQVYASLGKDPAIDKLLLDNLDTLRKQSRLGLTAPLGILDARAVLAEMRLIKGPEELPLLQAACDITAAGHVAAMRLAKAGMPEYELQAAIEYEFRRRGASAPGYGTIVAGGANATTLHYVENTMPLREDTLVLIDAGAEIHGYTGDVTRTFPISKRFEGPGKAVYEIVLAAQEASLAAAGPGKTLDEVHDAAARVITEGLVALGVLHGSADALFTEKAYKPFYMHRTSHWLGLDVHDAGLYSQEGKPRVLEPGMVFTVEPGLYFHADTAAPEHFHGIGVRIEDDVLVTLKGLRVLTEAIPRTIRDIEALR